MPYLILDPTDEYAAHEKRFLDRLGLEAVVLLSSARARGAWESRWRGELGAHVVAEYDVPHDELDAFAAELRAAFPDGFFGIVPWDERHVLLAAELSDALDLGWNSRAVIERFRDKSVLKAWLRAHGTARVNRARVVSDAADALAFQEEVGAWPIVVKPSGGAGSMSVFFARDAGTLLDGCQRVLESGLGEVLLEEYVGGTEYAVNGIVAHDGGVLVTDIWRYDKRDRGERRNLYYETLKLGSREEPFEALGDYAAAILDTLGLRRSPFHMEVKVDDAGPCVIECGARFAGGNQTYLASRLHHHSLFELAVCHYLDDLDVGPADVDYAYYDAHGARILSGIQDVEIESISAVHGVDEVRALPSFAGLGMLRRVGMRAPLSRDVNTKAWEVYLFHADPEQVAEDARAARRLLRYE